MVKKKSKDSSEIFPVILMGGLFVLIHGLAILVTAPFVEAGVQPAFEDPDNPINIIFIFVILLVFTVIILLIAKFWKKQLIQAIILGAIGYTAAYLMYPLFTLVIPQTTSARIALSNNYYLVISLSAILAIVFAIILIYVLYKYPEWYVIDICGIIVGAGAIAIFGISLGVLLVIIFLIALAIYDAISVYKTKHMIDLADTVIDLKLPVLLVIPKIRHYSLIRETKSLKEKLKDDEERDAFFMGLGDIVMPGILVTAVYNNIDGGLPIALSIIVGTLVGFAFLMTFVMKGKPQAGLPLLCGGAIAGYLISSLVFFGELRGLTFSF
jgi:presenilin-like A22 family membrane protease